MKTKLYRYASIAFIALSVLSILSVSIMAFISPQQVMDLVQVNLGNNDAFSSIRGVYGGVGISICVVIIYLSYQSLVKGLSFLSLFWGMYALSRIITIFIEGSLGSFGKQWLMIECIFALIALMLISLKVKKAKAL